MRILLTFSLAFCISLIYAQNLYFPPLAGAEWAQLPPEELGWCSDKVDSLIEFVEEKNTKAFIILKDGKIVVEEYFGTFTQDSAWYWASAGKSLMGVLIGLAQQEGRLDIEGPTGDYLGEGWTSCPPEEEQRITIRHQISMSTGLDDSLEPPGSTQNCFEPECFQCLAAPGARWAYHNSAYRIVQDVMEEATGVNKNVYTFSRLGSRIGMNGLWFNYVFYSRARDMARFGLFTLARGSWNGEAILTDTAYFNAMVNSSQDANPAYGYLWWLNGKASYQLPGLQFSFPGSLIPEAPGDLVAALGKDDQKIYVAPSLGLVVVRMGESAGGVSPAYSSFDNQLWERLMNLECVTAAEGMEPAQQELEVFPNPAGEMLNASTAYPIQKLLLLDNCGRVVREITGSGSPRQMMDIKGLAGGIYFLRAITDAGVGTRRVVIALSP
ncbi:MAG: serine hydrolase [Phaeodactylibacter sp.]|nr:serine hydrolase [Phaeodactylibacter sp.]